MSNDRKDLMRQQYFNMVSTLVVNIERNLEVEQRVENSLAQSLGLFIVDREKRAKDGSLVDIKNDLVTRNTNVLAYIADRMKYESIRVVEFEFVNFYGFTKKELMTFLEMLTTRLSRQEIEVKEFKQIAETLDTIEVKKTLAWRIMAMIVILSMYTFNDDVAVLARFLKTQLEEYLSVRERR